MLAANGDILLGGNNAMNKFTVEHLVLHYSDGTESLKDISLDIPEKSITVLFGPAGGGKSTFLRVLNRLNDLADVSHLTGTVRLYNIAGDYIDVLDPNIDVSTLRRRVGHIAQDTGSARLRTLM